MHAGGLTPQIWAVLFHLRFPSWRTCSICKCRNVDYVDILQSGSIIGRIRIARKKIWCAVLWSGLWLSWVWPTDPGYLGTKWQVHWQQPAEGTISSRVWELDPVDRAVSMSSTSTPPNLATYIVNILSGYVLGGVLCWLSRQFQSPKTDCP